MNWQSFKSLWIDRLSNRYSKDEASGIIRFICEEVNGNRLSLELLSGSAQLSTVLIDASSPHLEAVQNGKPVQYSLGYAYFDSMKLETGEAVLIPRPETEELVELCREYAMDPKYILDVGTGSGAIACAMQRSFPDAGVMGLDISAKALAYAKRNGERFAPNVEWRVMDFLKKHSWNELPTCDLIVSNPPYIPFSEASVSVDQHVDENEPSQALYVPDSDPLVFYRALFSFASGLRRPVQLFAEIHPPQREQLEDLANQMKIPFSFHKDLSAKDRFIRCNFRS